MKQLKRIEINWHTQVIRTYINGEFANKVRFTGAFGYQRTVITAWLESLHNKRFEMVAPAHDGAWVYEGWAI